MPAATITTSSAKAFTISEKMFGYGVRNVSDTTLYLSHSKAVAISGSSQGMTLEPGEYRMISFGQKLSNALTIFGIHGGSGSKAVIYEEFSFPVAAVAGVSSTANVTLNAGDVQIGAVEMKDGSTDTRGKVGAVSGLSAADNGIPVAARLFDIGEGDYETVAASQTDQSLGATGAVGDYLAGVLIVPGTTAAGAVSIKDGAGSAISIFAGGGTTALSTLIPFFVPLGIKSTGGAWKVTTGANVTAIGVGNFT